MYGVVALCVIGDYIVLFGALFAERFLRILEVVFLFLRNFFCLLLALFLAQSSFTSLQALYFAEDRLQLFGCLGIAFFEYSLHKCMVRVQHNGVSVRHLRIESHTLLILAHLFHTAHIFVLRCHNRLCGFAQRFYCHHKFSFLHLRHLRLECLREQIGVVFGKFLLVVSVVFHDDAVDNVRVYTHETRLFELLFEHRNSRNVQLSVCQNNRITLCTCRLDIRILLLLVGCVEVNKRAVLVGLVVFDKCAVLFVCEVLAVYIGKE